MAENNFTCYLNVQAFAYWHFFIYICIIIDYSFVLDMRWVQGYTLWGFLSSFSKPTLMLNAPNVMKAISVSTLSKLTQTKLKGKSEKKKNLKHIWDSRYNKI